MRRLLHWLTYGRSVATKPGVGEVHVTYRRWSGCITDVVVRPEGHEPLQLGPLSPATVQYLALSRAAETLRQRALQVQADRWLIDALAEFAVDASAPSLVEGWQGWGGRGAGVRGPAPHQLPPGGGHRPGGPDRPPRAARGERDLRARPGPVEIPSSPGGRGRAWPTTP